MKRAQQQLASLFVVVSVRNHWILKRSPSADSCTDLPRLLLPDDSIAIRPT